MMRKKPPVSAVLQYNEEKDLTIRGGGGDGDGEGWSVGFAMVQKSLA
ncbi:MAG: hypothetical protein U9R29_06825 [Thermodesulfobacteriota bacterium]|nr:hypothetical protein [Thermodesulfobacteriota bacterium]